MAQIGTIVGAVSYYIFNVRKIHARKLLTIMMSGSFLQKYGNLMQKRFCKR